MKNRKKYIATSNATLTQSGMLAALLKHQRDKVIELARRRAQRAQMRAVFLSRLMWLLPRAQSHHC
jgi:hypothetical protein